eukprot:CAMPEP_0117690412 /NCGR_PEP_ID=MMETSP0804-20121206/25109_1 /TAXON_ID=1074897 /ORGANISM="Tetraselmis astigmatica, Strain CCMP880" /LENGTH=994 /DNA_ID=CAMNT_0005503449 /DNA_START=86 /DNA_END=3070 /DNA_ORIENTATION=+
MAAPEKSGLASHRLFVVCGKEVQAPALRQSFEAYGNIENFRLIREKGVAYVTFDSVENATAAMEGLNGTSVPDVSDTLFTVKFADKPGSQRRASTWVPTAATAPAPPAADGGEVDDNIPPQSRLFIVCPRSADPNLLQEAAEQMEDLQYCKTDLVATKGVLFIKLSRMSSAMRALEDIVSSGTLAGYKVKAMIAEPKGKRGREALAEAAPTPAHQAARLDYSMSSMHLEQRAMMKHLLPRQAFEGYMDQVPFPHERLEYGLQEATGGLLPPPRHQHSINPDSSRCMPTQSPMGARHSSPRRGGRPRSPIPAELLEYGGVDLPSFVGGLGLGESSGTARRRVAAGSAGGGGGGGVDSLSPWAARGHPGSEAPRLSSSPSGAPFSGKASATPGSQRQQHYRHSYSGEGAPSAHPQLSPWDSYGGGRDAPGGSARMDRNQQQAGGPAPSHAADRRYLPAERLLLEGEGGGWQYHRHNPNHSVYRHCQHQQIYRLGPPNPSVYDFHADPHGSHLAYYYAPEDGCRHVYNSSSRRPPGREGPQSAALYSAVPGEGKARHPPQPPGIGRGGFPTEPQPSYSHEHSPDNASGSSGPALNRQDGQQPAAGPAAGPQRLFVVVAKSVSAEQLSHLFKRFPGMEYCDLKRDQATGRSKGYAYIKYSTHRSAQAAVEQLHGSEFPPTHTIKVLFAKPLGTSSRTSNKGSHGGRSHAEGEASSDSRTSVLETGTAGKEARVQVGPRASRKESGAEVEAGADPRAEGVSVGEAKRAVTGGEVRVEQQGAAEGAVRGKEEDQDEERGLENGKVEESGKEGRRRRDEDDEDEEDEGGEEPRSHPESQSDNADDQQVEQPEINCIQNSLSALRTSVEGESSKPGSLEAVASKRCPGVAVQSTGETLRSWEAAGLLGDISETQEVLVYTFLQKPLPDYALQHVFSDVGPVTSVQLHPDDERYSLVRYSDASSAVEALKTLDGTDIFGIPLSVMASDPLQASRTTKRARVAE